MNILVGANIIVLYLYFELIEVYNSLVIHLRSAHATTLEVAGLKLRTKGLVLNLSAPEILQRPAPQPGAPLFGAPRPEHPSAPANPCPPQDSEKSRQTIAWSAGLGKIPVNYGMVCRKFHAFLIPPF